MNIKNIKFKIVFFSTLCIAIVGIAGNIYLYNYMNGIISEKAADIDTLYMDTIEQSLESHFEKIINLRVLCTNSYEITNALRHSSLDTLAAKKDVFNAQNTMNKYLYTSPTATSYINKLMLFNDNGLTIQSMAAQETSLQDLPNLLKSDFYKNYQEGDLPFSTVMPSVTAYKGDCLPLLSPVSNYFSPVRVGYFYLEVDTALITDILNTYSSLNPIFAVTDAGNAILPTSRGNFPLDDIELLSLSDGSHFVTDGREYKVNIRHLNSVGLSLYNCTDISALSIDSRRRSYAVIVVLLSVLLTALGITIIITNYITKPIQKLVARIKRISESDFSLDLKSEAREDELGQVFKTINEMSLSIDRLLKENAEKNEQKKNIEIDLLQSQINPHFLYNTLDSIHWMAVIQKNPGICNITRCLANLLKNMSKGFSQKIPLSEEISLLNDYITIQSIRYLETFELVDNINKDFYRYSIVKLTLQPLVENAIFHGIEPSGVSGTITLDAQEEGDYLLIEVTDTGVGMSQEDIKRAMEDSPNRTLHSMNGIGVGNVHKRLQLVYGQPCGLAIESEKGKGTRILVRIRKEEAIHDIPDTVSG